MRKLLRYTLIVLLCSAILLGLSACGGDDVYVFTLYTYDPGDSFVTNIKDSNFLLRCDVTFRLIDEDAVEAFLADNDIIRDSVIKVLRNLTEYECRNGDLDDVAQRLVDSANEAMETEVFYSAYFDSWTVTR